MKAPFTFNNLHLEEWAIGPLRLLARCQRDWWPHVLAMSRDEHVLEFAVIGAPCSKVSPFASVTFPMGVASFREAEVLTVGEALEKSGKAALNDTLHRLMAAYHLVLRMRNEELSQICSHVRFWQDGREPICEMECGNLQLATWMKPMPPP